ncbi:MAG: ABC transporter substrate-binding protein [Pseudomonadota bacterium]
MLSNGDRSRRELLKLATGAALFSAAPFAVKPAFSASPSDVSLVSRDAPDLSGKQPRVVLGDGHLIVALSLMLDNPVSVLAGWQGDVPKLSPELYNAYRVRHPELADIPVLGEAAAPTFSVERALALKPDVLVLGGAYGPGPADEHLSKRFESAGIPVVYVDFYQDPLANTADSLRLLGKMFGGAAKSRAFEYADLHERRVASIRERSQAISRPRPRVLLEANAAMQGMGCCWVPGGKGLGKFVTLAGGHNLGTELAPGRAWLKAEQEHILTSAPDVYVATGGPYQRGTSGLEIGPGVSQEDAKRQLAIAASASLTRVAATLPLNRIHGIWHLFHVMPVNILVMETLAQWLHPDIFENDDEALTLDRLNRDFLSVPLEGCFAVSL